MGITRVCVYHRIQLNSVPTENLTYNSVKCTQISSTFYFFQKILEINFSIYALIFQTIKLNLEKVNFSHSSLEWEP